MGNGISSQDNSHVPSGPDFYDDEEVFHTYIRARMRPHSPNETLEKPVTWELLGDVTGKHILDLGCGDGAIGRELLQAGCQSYTGVEASRRMVALAERELVASAGTVILSSIEQWQYPPASFDIVLSRLALHYVDDLAPVFQNVHQTLKASGRFVFCIEHPVISSCNRSRGESGDDTRQDWLVDDYFVTGKREVKWLGRQVTKYHRTVEDYFALLQNANFTVTHLRESRPLPQRFSDEALFQRRSRIPLFLFLAGQRAVT